MSAVAGLARAVPDDVVRAIVGDHYQRAAPTPPPAKSIVDQLVEKFGPKAVNAQSQQVYALTLRLRHL